MGIKSRLLKFKPNSLEQTFREMAQRFAVPFFCSLALTIVFLCHVRFNNDNSIDINSKAWWYVGFISLIPSFFTTVAVSLIFENYAPQKPSWFKNLSNFCVVMALALYTHYMLPFNVDENIATFVQLCFWCFALVFVAHHDYKNDNLVFWHNTKYILGTVLLAMFLSLVLFIGTSCVLKTIDALFGTKIFDPMFFTISIILVFLGAPSLVMAQLPNALTTPTNLSMQQAGIVTKALVFIQWLLTAVLLAYAARILVGWQLPKGRVVYQVGSYAVGGILVYFWAYHAQATKFVATYIRHWPKVLLGLALLPATAISLRIAAHGITPNRLLVVYLLVAIAIFGIITLWPKLINKRLHIAATSLLAVAFLAFFSPINAQRVAKHYFGYDPKITSQKAGMPVYFQIDIDDPMNAYGDLSKTGLNIAGYNYVVPVRLTDQNKFEFTLNRPQQPKLLFKLKDTKPFTLTIAYLGKHQTKTIPLDKLIDYKIELAKDNRNNIRRHVEKPVSTTWQLGQHKLRLDVVSLHGMYRWQENTKTLKSLEQFEFYLLIK